MWPLQPQMPRLSVLRHAFYMAYGSVLYRLRKEGGHRNAGAWEMKMLALWQKPLSCGIKRGQLRRGIQRQ